MTTPRRPDGPPVVPIDTDAGRMNNRSTAYCFSVMVVMALLAEAVAFEFTFVIPALGDFAALYQTPNIGWMLTVASLAGGAATPLAGKMSDIYGKKRIVMWMCVVFVLGSVVCAMAPNLEIMLVGRTLQGIAIPINIVCYGIIRDLMPRRLVPIGLGVLSSGVGGASILGPLIGGALIDNVGVMSIFWFLVVYGIVCGALMFVLVPESPVRSPQKLDHLGAVLLVLFIGVLLFGVTNGSTWAWLSVKTVGTFVLAALLGAALFSWQRRAAAPILPPDLLRRPAVRITLAIAFFGQFGIVGLSFLVPMMTRTPIGVGFDYALGLSAFDFGLEVTLFRGAVGIIAGFAGGWLVRRYGPRLIVMLGCTAMGLACLQLAVLHSELWHYQLSQVLNGVAIGLYYAAIANLIVEVVPARQQGIGAGVLGVMHGVAAAAGPAVLGTILAQYVLSSSQFSAIFYTSGGYVVALASAGVITLAGTVFAWFMQQGRSPASGGLEVDIDTATEKSTSSIYRSAGTSKPVLDDVP